MGQGFYASCRTEWQDEIFLNCMDAEVVVDGAAPTQSSKPELVPNPPQSRPTSSPQPKPVPEPQPLSTQAPQPQPATTSMPAGDCISSGGEAFTMACAQLNATCELYSFCARVPAGSSPVPPPAMGACVSNDPSIDYSAACKALEATCELYSFCKRAPAFAQGSEMASARQNLRRVRRMLLQQGVLVEQGAATEKDESSTTELSDVRTEL